MSSLYRDHDLRPTHVFVLLRRLDETIMRDRRADAIEPAARYARSESVITGGDATYDTDVRSLDALGVVKGVPFI